MAASGKEFNQSWVIVYVIVKSKTKLSIDGRLYRILNTQQKYRPIGL